MKFYVIIYDNLLETKKNITRSLMKMKQQVLCVDNNYKTAMILQIILNTLNINYSQTKEISLSELIKEDSATDLIILDYEIKGAIDTVSYLELLQSKFPNLPVIIVANNIEAAKQETKNFGIKGYIQGPIVNETYIKEAVSKILDI
jgi:CheY-like chemotaxis protein